MLRYSIFSLIFLAVLQKPEVNAVCCQPDGRNAFTGNAGTCDDGTLGDICCGVGECNVFCCNCDGGCIMANPTNIAPGPPPGIAVPVQQSRRKRLNLPYSQRRGTYYPRFDSYRAMDTNLDNKISWREAYAVMMSGRIGNPTKLMPTIPSYFNAMDWNKDGYLDRCEIGG